MSHSPRVAQQEPRSERLRAIGADEQPASHRAWSIASTARRRRADAPIAFVARTHDDLVDGSEYSRTLERAMRSLVPRIADVCIVDVLGEDGALERVAAAHVDERKESVLRELLVRYPVDVASNHPIARAVRTGTSESHAFVDADLWADFGPTPVGFDLADRLRLRAYGVVPLIARKRAIGALFCGFVVPGRSLGPEQLALAENFALSVSLAADHARALRSERAARLRLERSVDRATQLRNLACALSQTLSEKDAATAVVEQAMAALGAQSAAIARVVSAKNELVVVSSTGVEDEIRTSFERFPMDAPLPACEAARTRQPVFVETVRQRDSRYPHLADTHERMGNGAFAAVPLMVSEEVVAVLGLAFRQPRSFTVEDRAFILTVAEQCAQAFHRARLFAQLESAVRRRDEALAVVSHDLLNPVAAMRMTLHSLTKKRARKRSQEDDGEYLALMDRALLRMQSLLRQLLDSAKLEDGQTVLRLERCDVRQLLEATRETFQAQAAERAISLRVEVATDPGDVACDRALLLRMLDNLVANALKFTPEGGAVVLRAEPVAHGGEPTESGGSVHVSVEDTGAGIAAEHIPHLFDRYWQLRETAHLGSGLGLSIVRGIARAHGGRVDVASTVGVGTTFHVWLPSDGPSAPPAGERAEV